MRIEDVKAYMEWRKDTSKPHPWFAKVLEAHDKRKDDYEKEKAE